MCIHGKALCIVELVNIEPFTPAHCAGALMEPFEVPEKGFAWHFDNLEWIEPFDVKGKLHLFDVDDSLIEIIPETVSSYDALTQYYEPLIYWGRDKTAREEWAAMKEGYR